MDEYKYGEKVYAGFWGYRHENPKKAFRYRCGPVPGVCNWGHGGWFRYPKTKQELTNYYIPDPEDYEVLTAHQINQLSKVRDIPTAWDDIPRSRRGDSWKNYRLTRYKAG